MTTPRLNPPPKPSLPVEAPWREIEQLHEDMRFLAQLINALTQTLRQAAGVTVTVTPSEVTPAAIAAPATPGLTGYQRGGVVTSAGDNTVEMASASWETNMWQGWEVEIVGPSDSPAIAQVRRVISNTLNKLTLRKNWDMKPTPGDLFVLRPRYPMDNPNSFVTFKKTVAAAGTPEKLTAYTVPNGWPVIILALPDNTDDIFFAISSAASLDTDLRFDRLEPGKSFPLYVSKTDLIWIDAASSGEGVSAYVPQWAVDS